MRKIILIAFVLSAAATTATAQSRVEKNVVFGMYSGLALLMDVYHPAKPNGFGILFIQGSGWSAPMRYDALPITARPEAITISGKLAAAGYTVFTINHRAAPRFHYPAQVEDGQRAVRFVRTHAADYGIDPAHIGAMGSSSGGYLAEMLGTLGGEGTPQDSDPVNRASAKVQVVVAIFAPSNLVDFYSATSNGLPALVAMMGSQYQDMNPNRPVPGRVDDLENQQYRQASTTTYVTSDDAPMLLLHGDADDIVPMQQSVTMAETLTRAQVENRFIKVPGGKHGFNFQLPAGDPRLPDYLGEAVRWFDKHLK